MAAAAADELAVDALGFVELGANDVQAADVEDARAEADVGAAAGHVGGDGDFAELAGGGDNFGFAFDVLGVEDRHRGAAGGEHAGDFFAFVDRARADEDGAAEGVLSEGVFDDALPLLFRVAVDERRELLADRRAVRGDRFDVDGVDLAELAAAGGGGDGGG